MGPRPVRQVKQTAIHRAPRAKRAPQAKRASKALKTRRPVPVAEVVINQMHLNGVEVEDHDMDGIGGDLVGAGSLGRVQWCWVRDLQLAGRQSVHSQYFQEPCKSWSLAFSFAGCT